ncbi:uncharacterized protein LOC113756173 [Coffea eugenioides]|uniref:uncharacterized protein LOC113756173 n=1 Tax=Coffea eugenioides TaxID=49369 RepID=UPI000F611CD0|nr:uncharacterized protein LOC113756173 [Coffea eugenioides]
MPPEPLPWDRKDFFKERKHERQEPYHHHHHHHHLHPTGGGGGGGGGYGGGIGGFGGGPRWREPPHPHPHPYHYASPRWVSDFRYRPPPGYGKQGGRHLYPEESSHGFVPSRPSDRVFEDENCRGSVSGKYSRSNRESRGPFGQKDWKGQSWEATPSPNAPGRPLETSDQHRSVDEMQTCTSSHPHLDSANSWDQSHLKDQHEKSSGVVNALGSSGQRLERENSLGSMDWKPLKWTRSGSLSSRGSGFSHSSSSKSMGADSNEMKAEVQPSNVTPVQSPSGNAATPVAAPAAAYETSAGASEEMSSRKKPRLGWGEGLAKYEKKRVEGVDDTTLKNGTIICSSSREPLHLHSSHLADKSPRITAFSDCASPATPSSVGCSSSPGLEEKQFIKAPSVDNEATNLSPSIASQDHRDHIEGATFNLENLDLAESGHFNSAINELLLSDDLISVDSGFVKSTAINKLLVWKGDVLKKLEMTESEIDRLEGELKTLASIPESSCHHPAVSNSLPMDCFSKPAEEQDVTSSISHRPALLDLGSSGHNDAEKMPNVLVDDHAKVKDEDVDSPGSATSKFVEVVSSGKDASPSEPGNEPGNDSVCISNTDCAMSKNLELSYVGNGVHEDNGGENFQLVASCSPTHLDEISLCDDKELKLCESIFASNKESASRAAEVFNKLLPADLCKFDISGVCSLKSNSIVKENFLRRKRFQQFKERCIALKYRALQHLWKADVCSLSMRRFRVKSHKKLDLSLRTVLNSSQKHRTSFRSRLSSHDGNVSSGSNTVMMNFISKLLSDSQVKPCRDTLKMPAMILDKKEKMISRFISSNGLVEDPSAVEKERSMINPWTSEEKEMFMDKLAVHGKDFTKIASFLVHKTTADCVEFYYKNHKSDCFKKTKKHPEYPKQGKSYTANNYLVASGKRWHCEANAASLDILGAASAIAANVDDGMEIQQTSTSKYLLGRSSDYKSSKGDNGLLERLSSLDADNNERETAAADVLAGICGSLSSEAMSSCITSAVDPGEGYHEWKYSRVGSSSRLPLTPEAMQNGDEDTCSDESCGEMDPTDWTDEEKAIFIQAVSSYGKDFAMISRYVSTRSREQCKVFFSKARKCLGLDMISPGPGNVVRRDASGGSDTDDVGVVETGSITCSEKSGVKLEVDLPCPEVKLNIEPDSAGLANVNPDLNHLEEISGTGDRAAVEAGLQSKNLTDDSQMEEKPEQEADGNGDIQSVHSGEVEQGTAVTTRGVGETSDSANTLDTQIHSGALEKRDEHLDAEMEGLSPVSWESSINDRKEKDDANQKDVNGMDQDLKSTPDGDISGDRQIGVLETDSVGRPCVVPIEQNGFPAPMKSVPQSCAVECQTPNEATSSALEAVKISGEQGHQVTRVGEKLRSGSSLLGSVDPCQILKGYPLPPSTTREVNGNSSCRRSATPQSFPKVDNNFHRDRHLAHDSYLQKCNGVKHYSSIAELPFKFREQSRDINPDHQSGSPSDVEKPRRNGDVKLFGQILTKPSYQPKSSSSRQQNGDNENQQSKIGKPLGTKFASDQAIGGNLSQTKLDRNNLLGTENLPVRSFAYWDGSRIQTGLHSLPDSAMLLAKYPAAFGNYVLPSSKLEQLPVHGVNNGERSLNGSAVFPAREIGSSNAAADYQAYRSRELQPFTLDMKQRQDAVLSEMHRRNGFDVVSGMQQAARGLVGINVVSRAGILVGGQCTGVSDPVAAIKMHYSKAEQLNGGQTASIIREDDSWRGKGSIGR